MGQKVNPVGFRLGLKFDWKSRWFAKSDEQYRKYLSEDIKIRKFLREKLSQAGLSRVEIERTTDRIFLTLFVARPGIVIGRGGTGLEELKKQLLASLGLSSPAKLKLEVREVTNPDLDAYLVAWWAAKQLERRMPYRGVMRRVVERVMGAGAEGVKIMLSGRIAGAEIARQEHLSEGKIALGTLRTRVDFAQVPALTKYGYIGVKVWINKGE